MSIPVITATRHQNEESIKAAVGEYIRSALDETTFNTRDLAHLYAVSVTAYRASNLRASVVSRVPLRVVNKNGQPVPDHPLQHIVAHESFQDTLLRCELTMCFWGYTLIVKRRMVSGRVTGLQWLNPQLYQRDIDSRGLKGFRVSIHTSSYETVEVDYIPRHDAVFMHGLDFDDDFGGVAPAEAAFNHAGIEAEAGLTVLSYMRNRAVPLGLLQPAQDVNAQPTDQAIHSMRDLLARIVKGARNAGKTIVSKGRWEWVAVQQMLKDVEMGPHWEAARTHVAMAFDMSPDLLVPSDATYAAHFLADSGWVEYWVKPRCEWYARQITAQLAPEFDDDIKLEPDFAKVIKGDQKAQTEVANSQVQTGYLTLYDAQVRTNHPQPDERLKDFYLVQGTPVHISRFPELADKLLLTGASGGSLFPPTDDGVLSLPSQVPQLLPPRPTQESRSISVLRSASAGTPSVTALLRLADPTPLSAVLQTLHASMPDADGVRWVPDDHYHITLVHAPLCSDDQLAAVQQAVQGQYPALELRAGPTGIFEQDEQNVVYLQVELSPALQALQAHVFDAFALQGIPVSAHSIPVNYKPHITLAYVAKDVPLATCDQVTTVQPSQIEFSREDFKTVGTVPLKQAPAVIDGEWLPDDLYDELRTCVRVVARKGAEYDFASDLLPADIISLVRMLVATGSESDLILSLARKALVHRRPAVADQFMAGKAIQATRLDFEADFEDLLVAFRDKDVDRRTWANRLRTLLTKCGEKAYRDGLTDGGVVLEEDEALEDDDRADLNRLLAEQSKYVTNLGALLKDKGISDGQAGEKPAMWFNKSIMPIYQAGRVSADKNGMALWVLNPLKKNCPTCKAASGQVHRWKDWYRKNILPQSDSLVCRGFFCGCKLVPAEGRAVGRLDRIPLNAGKADTDEHTHDEGDPMAKRPDSFPLAIWAEIDRVLGRRVIGMDEITQGGQTVYVMTLREEAGYYAGVDDELAQLGLKLFDERLRLVKREQPSDTDLRLHFTVRGENA